MAGMSRSPLGGGPMAGGGGGGGGEGGDQAIPLDYNQPLTRGDFSAAQAQQKASPIFGAQAQQGGGGDQQARIAAIRQLLMSQGGGQGGGPIRSRPQPGMM